MAEFNIALIKGDGIGPEIVDSSRNRYGGCCKKIRSQI